MRLVIHNRQGATASGLQRYRGEGIFSSIGRKLFSSGLKKVINVASKANLPQKIADVVVNGAKSGGEKLGTLAVEKLTHLFEFLLNFARIFKSNMNSYSVTTKLCPIF